MTSRSGGIDQRADSGRGDGAAAAAAAAALPGPQASQSLSSAQSSSAQSSPAQSSPQPNWSPAARGTDRQAVGAVATAEAPTQSQPDAGPAGAPGEVDEANEPTVDASELRAPQPSAPDTPQSLQLPSAYARDRQAPSPSPWSAPPANPTPANPTPAWSDPLSGPRVQDLEHAEQAWPTPTPVARRNTPTAQPPAGAQGGYGDLASEILGRDSAPGMHRLDPAPPPSLGGGNATPWSAEWGSGNVDERDRLGPFMPPVPLARPPKSQTQLVIIVLAGLVVLGLILAAVSLRGLFSSAPLTPDPKASTSASAAAQSSSAAAASASAASSAAASAASGGPVVDIAGVKAIDPQGDGTEGDASAPRIIDDDPTTYWRSERYNSATFGGLGKNGVGLVLDLGDTATVNQVTLQFKGSGGAVELRSATDPSFDGSQVLATGSLDGGSTTLTATAPVRTRYLVLWFTKVTLQSNGEYRLLVSEVSVR